jgi:DNA-binding transcriptional regulator GbsR (MarR family)
MQDWLRRERKNMSITHSDVSEIVRETYLSPSQVSEMIPGMTTGNLAQLRFIKPSPKVVVYALSAIQSWLAESERTGTAKVAS